MSQVQTKWIANNAVTLGKIQQLPTNTLIGNNTGSTGNALGLTVAQVQSMLSIPTSGSPLPVNSGGTGLSSLTSGSVIIGAGTSSPTFVAPGTSGNVLTSSGGVWASVAPAASGTVTSVSVVSANGFAGTVATATTTPAITISTSINSPVLAGNGTAISAASTTGTGSTVALSASPTFTGTVATAGLTSSAPSFSGALNMNTNQINNLAMAGSPAGTDATNVSYVQTQ